jgi:endonuclease YncB( thermonuclease family)
MTVRTAPASITRVIDGDTLIATLHVWDHPRVDLTDTRFRLDGINSPEMSTPEGVIAKAFAERWLVDENGDWRTISVTTRGLDNYGRTLAGIEAKGQSGSLNQALLDSGNAVVMKMIVRDEQ